MTPAALAKTIDHALLAPTLRDRDFDAGCDIALRYGVAALCVKSVDVVRATKRVLGSPVAVCAVVGFPHGNAKLDVTLQETAIAMGEGATEIDAVVPLSRVLSGDFEAVTEFASRLNESVTSQRGILKLIFETGLIADAAAKVQLCEICKQAGVAFVKTSTGFATEKHSNGALHTLGATLSDVRLLVEHAVPICRVKASGGIRTRAEAIGFLELGASRIGTGATAEILSAVE